MLIIWIVLEIKNYMNNKKRSNLDYMEYYKKYHLWLYNPFNVWYN